MIRNCRIPAQNGIRCLFYMVLMINLIGPTQRCAWGQEAELNNKNTPSLSRRNTVHLYFSDRKMRFLTAEKRELLCDSDDISLGKCIINALIEGPRRGLGKVLPQGTELKAFFIADDGTAYVNLNDAVSRNHPGGARSELFTVFAIVNSLTLNLSDVNRVQILIDGRQPETLAGHIAISDPFKANILLIR